MKLPKEIKLKLKKLRKSEETFRQCLDRILDKEMKK